MIVGGDYRRHHHDHQHHHHAIEFALLVCQAVNAHINAEDDEANDADADGAHALARARMHPH